MEIFIGCPVWSAKAWVGTFYPPGTRSGEYLREYTRRLTTVEGNTTFYAIPAQTTLERWAAEMPVVFRFCAKIPRAISHAGKLAGHEEEAAGFAEVMRQLADRLGPMFLQLPPSYSPAMLDDLRAFLEAWPGSVRLAVEVRHPGWFDPPHHQALNDLLARHRMARVVIDTRPIRSMAGEKMLEGSVYQKLLEARERKPDVPVIPELTTDFVFVRYIGHPQLETNSPFLDEWADYLAAQSGDASAAYVFCHCPDDRLDPWICRSFHRHLAQRISIAGLPWDNLDEETISQQPLL
jgi:uncharacterized protein YecE (DUF72 family)